MMSKRPDEKKDIFQLAGTEHKPQDLSMSQGSSMFQHSVANSKEPTQTERIMISWLLIIYGRNL